MELPGININLIPLIMQKGSSAYQNGWANCLKKENL
jgi:hypothetical protein